MIELLQRLRNGEAEASVLADLLKRPEVIEEIAFRLRGWHDACDAFGEAALAKKVWDLRRAFAVACNQRTQ